MTNFTRVFQLIPSWLNRPITFKGPDLQHHRLTNTVYWRWLPLRLSKRQSPTTVRFRTIFTRRSFTMPYRTAQWSLFWSPDSSRFSWFSKREWIVTSNGQPNSLSSKSAFKLLVSQNPKSKDITIKIKQKVIKNGILNVFNHQDKLDKFTCLTTQSLAERRGLVFTRANIGKVNYSRRSQLGSNFLSFVEGGCNRLRKSRRQST